MMKSPYGVIRQPVITEKSTIEREASGVYCFRVHPRATKLEIAQALEQIFEKDKVKVASVRTASVQGKTKRMGRFTGKRADWKKAWVRLAPGSGEIEFFEAT